MNALTTRQAAALVGVSEHIIKRWAHSGLLPHTVVQRRLAFQPEDVRAAQRLAHAGDVIPRWRADPVRAGARLRALREEAGLTQLQLAAHCGLAHEEISRLEHGLKSPLVLTLRKLCAGLGLEPVRLVADDPIGLHALSTSEAATQLGVPPRRLQRWLLDGVLPGSKLGGRWRIPAVAVAEFARSGRLRGISRRLDR